jgi:cadmium resistance protein CadD (predicted permease)
MSLLKTLREPKILDMAVFDWVATFIAALIFTKYVVPKWNVIIVFILFVILGIFVHVQTGTPTMFNYYLGQNSYEQVMESRI